MHLAYADDSGRDNARTVTGLVVPAHGWNEFLHCWLEARERLTATWGVRKHAELHGIELARGRGSYCASDEEELVFRRRHVRLRAYDLMLAALAQCENLVVTTVCTDSAHLPTAYRKFVEHLQQWATSVDSRVLIMLDGQGYPVGTESITADKTAAKVLNAYRDAMPFQRVHRDLHLRARRVIEDPFIQDSKLSQLIQAADLAAYAATQWIWENTEVWPKGPNRGRPVTELATSYERLSNRWLPNSDHGIYWASRHTTNTK
ncbi:DUF3800 domain-containing protein [Actinomycetes bacterium KLBMP 9797]